MSKEDPKFFHFRLYDANGYVEPRGGVTLCVEEGNMENRPSVGVAVCSPEDNFNKKLGREIAFGRMRERINDYSVDTKDSRDLRLLALEEFQDLLDGKPRGMQTHFRNLFFDFAPSKKFRGNYLEPQLVGGDMVNSMQYDIQKQVT